MNIFNYFGELKKELNLPSDVFDSYNLINISGKLLYVEGHYGLNVISDDNIVFKIKNGTISIKGKQLILKTLSQTTMAIQGKIYKIEVF